MIRRRCWPEEDVSRDRSPLSTSSKKNIIAQGTMHLGNAEGAGKTLRETQYQKVFGLPLKFEGALVNFAPRVE
jgi:hypothetical protein